MENFSKFFSAAKEKCTPNTKTHHQITIRSTDRKHQNQVARCYGVAGRKDDPIVDTIVKNEKVGKWPIGAASAQRLLKTYGIKHLPENSYSKAINRTGININYNANTKLFSLSKLRK